MKMSKQEKVEFQQERFYAQQKETREQMQMNLTSSNELMTKKQDGESEKIGHNQTNISGVKSRQQLEMERDEMIKRTINHLQSESSSLSERIKKEEEDRNKMIQQENQRISDEFQARQEILRAAENKRLRQIEEEKQKIEARKKFLQEERERVEEQIKLEAARKAEEMAKEQRNLDEQRKLEMKKKKELEKQRILETKKIKVEETSTIKRKVDQSMRAVTASPQVKMQNI